MARLKRKNDFEIINEIKNDLASLRQRLEETVLPLIKKHDNCLYGERGDNGMVTSVKTMDSKIAGNVRIIWALIIPLVLGVVVVIIKNLVS